MERTLAILKPDCVRKNLIGKVTDHLLNAGFEIIGMKMTKLSELFKVLSQYQYVTHRRVTFEYIMIKDINDSPEQARQLCRLIKPIKANINLVEYNPHQGCAFEPSSQKAKPPAQRVCFVVPAGTQSFLAATIVFVDGALSARNYTFWRVRCGGTRGRMRQDGR